ncbi:MAG TPA: molybdate ABC transporter substrate-binding protein [Candidatus Limnocylindrales bacterium]|nr:molybdate ABC transporter substrate-binding protein [Candidatus Limnocylindrales bacterium]
MIRGPVLGVVLAAFVGACSGGIAASPTVQEPSIGCCDPTAPSVNLTVFAASSLKGALDKVATAYAAATGNTITVSTDSSAALETQIEQGAPADVFLSADTTNPAKLVAGGFTSGNPVKFAGNTLVIIVAPGNPAGIATPFDLGRPGVKVIAAGDDVPITAYATKLVQNLAIAPGAPMGFERLYAKNVVSKEDNVKAVVAKVELGEGDAAIVYATDARSSLDTPVIEVTPASANVPATYAGVVVKASAHQADAAGFLEWLASPDGQAILATFGFLPPS